MRLDIHVSTREWDKERSAQAGAHARKKGSTVSGAKLSLRRRAFAAVTAGGGVVSLIVAAFVGAGTASATPASPSASTPTVVGYCGANHSGNAYDEISYTQSASGLIPGETATVYVGDNGSPPMQIQYGSLTAVVGNNGKVTISGHVADVNGATWDVGTTYAWQMRATGESLPIVGFTGTFVLKDGNCGGPTGSPSPAKCVTLTDGNISQYGTLTWSATKATVTLKERDGGYCNDWAFSQASHSLDNPPKLWPQTVAAVSSAKVGKSGLSASATVNATTCGQNDGYTGSGPKVGDKLSGPGKDYEATHKLLSAVFGGPNSWDIETSGCNQKPPCPIVGELKCGVNDFSIPDVVVRGEKGSSHLVAQITVPAELQGKTVNVTATVTNNGSVHPGSTVILSSDGSSVTLSDVEATKDKVTTASGTLKLGKTVDVTVKLGSDGVFSAGGDLKITVDCSQPTPPPPPAFYQYPNATAVISCPAGVPTIAITHTNAANATTSSDFDDNLNGTMIGNQSITVQPGGSVTKTYTTLGTYTTNGYADTIWGPWTLSSAACANPTPGPTVIPSSTAPAPVTHAPSPNPSVNGQKPVTDEIANASWLSATRLIAITVAIMLFGAFIVATKPRWYALIEEQRNRRH